MLFARHLLIFLLFIKANSIYIGLDIGSYFTKASTVVSNEHPIIATNYETKRMTPTFIAFRTPPDFDFLNKSMVSPAEARTLLPEFGQNALSLMTNRPWLGMGFMPYFIDINETEITRLSKIFNQNISAARVSYQDCTALFYKYFITSIAKGRPVQGIDIVVPAFFTIPQRVQLKRMIKICHFTKNIRVLDDVDAISHVYSNSKSSRFQTEPQLILFIDVGATTIKSYAILFSVRNETNGEKSVISTRVTYEYDTENGGAFLTSKMIKYISSKLKIDKPTDSEKWRMFEASEKLKKQLTLTENATVTIENINGKDETFTMTRSELEILSKDLLESLVRVVSRASANLTINDCELIGGSSRLPFIQKAFEMNNLTHLKIGRKLNADETLAIGAGYYSQFIRELSRFSPIVTYDIASPYTITLFTSDSMGIVCRKGTRCATSIGVNGSSHYLLFAYDKDELRRGILSATFGYSLKELEENVELLFLHNPFDLHSARICRAADEIEKTQFQENPPENADGKKVKLCRDILFAPIEQKKKVSPVFKAIVRKDKSRKLMANAHNKLELLVQRIENELEFNASVIRFTSPQQKAEIKQAVEAAKKWIFEEADKATVFKNFTVIVDSLNSLMSPIYKKVAESKALNENIKLYVETLRLSHYALDNDWNSKSNIPPDVIEEFRKLLNETEEWYLNATDANSHATIDDLPPFRAKDFEKHGRNLYQEFLKIERIANATPSPSPAPTTSNANPNPDSNGPIKSPSPNSDSTKKEGIFSKIINNVINSNQKQNDTNVDL